MSHFPHAACQSAANFPKAFGLGDLAEEHGNKMLPRIERFRKSLRLMAIDKLMKIFSINKRNHLTEQARMLYHFASSLFFGLLMFCGETTIPARRIFFQDPNLSLYYCKMVFGQE
jgi:hypothetical protein